MDDETTEALDRLSVKLEDALERIRELEGSLRALDYRVDDAINSVRDVERDVSRLESAR